MGAIPRDRFFHETVVVRSVGEGDLSRPLNHQDLSALGRFVLAAER